MLSGLDEVLELALHLFHGFEDVEEGLALVASEVVGILHVVDYFVGHVCAPLE